MSPKLIHLSLKRGKKPKMSSQPLKAAETAVCAFICPPGQNSVFFSHGWSKSTRKSPKCHSFFHSDTRFLLSRGRTKHTGQRVLFTERAGASKLNGNWFSVSLLKWICLLPKQGGHYDCSKANGSLPKTSVFSECRMICLLNI